MARFAYGCVFFLVNRMDCACVSAVQSPGPSAVFMDYKAMRTSRGKTEQTDETAALVQPKALRCSPESSDQLRRGDWRKVLHPVW